MYKFDNLSPNKGKTKKSPILYHHVTRQQEISITRRWILSKLSGMWTLKQNTSPPKLYEILIKTDMKGDTALDLNIFYKKINSCLNTVAIIKEDMIPAYHKIKWISEFHEQFMP